MNPAWYSIELGKKHLSYNKIAEPKQPRPILVFEVRPKEGPVDLERSADNHRSIESGRLALPDVLAAGARHRLCGLFLCHRLPTDGTIFTPHIGSAFSSTNRCNAGGHVTLTDHGVEFFTMLQCGEKRERFSVGCYRSG
jgi:hypothetical protein